MIGIGIAELVLLGVCSLVMLAGFMGAIIWIVAARRRGHGPLVPCPQCGRNSPPGSHCPNCGAVRQ